MNKEVSAMEGKQPMRFPRETAGRIMTRNVPVVSSDVTIRSVRDLLSDKGNDFETINYIYLVDPGKRLRAALSIKDVFQVPDETKALSVAEEQLVTAKPRVDQEQIALLALRHNLKAIPVVDKRGVFLGVVPSDVILRVLHNEAIEDVLRSAGVQVEDDPAVSIIRASALIHFRKRLPWLLVGLAGGIAAAFIVGFFEEPLQEHILLAAFIPAVVYMADAVGAQSQTIFIRSLALDKTLTLKGYLAREIKVNFFLALVLGSMIALFALALWQDVIFGMILGLSIFATILMAMGVALLLPWILMKRKSDPAISSGPFATVIRDLLSLVIYFAIAETLLSAFAI